MSAVDFAGRPAAAPSFMLFASPRLALRLIQQLCGFVYIARKTDNFGWLQSIALEWPLPAPLWQPALSAERVRVFDFMSLA